MATSKSSKKRIRQNAVRRQRNSSAKSALRTTIKNFKATVKSGDADATASAFRAVQKKIDKTSGKGIVRKGTAARIKSRLSAEAKRLAASKSKAE